MTATPQTAVRAESLHRVVIEPLSRVEGHGKVTLQLDEDGHVMVGARRDAASAEPCDTTASLLAGQGPEGLMAQMAGTATTVGVVATDAHLSKAEATQLASLAHAGLARTVSPLTVHDGDTFFALATGAAGRAGNLSLLGAMAADCVARAIRAAVRAATPLADPPLPAWRPPA